jgi:hypothetical protein
LAAPELYAETVVMRAQPGATSRTITGSVKVSARSRTTRWVQLDVFTLGGLVRDVPQDVGAVLLAPFLAGMEEGNVALLPLPTAARGGANLGKWPTAVSHDAEA